MAVRLIASDMDDTLLNSKIFISERNAAAIHKAIAKGVVFLTSKEDVRRLYKAIELCIKIFSDTVVSLQFSIFYLQSEQDEVRRVVYDHGRHIAREEMLTDMEKYYVILDVRKGTGPMEKSCYFRYGRCLIKEKNPVLLEYLDKECRTMTEIREKLKNSGTEGARKRLSEIDLILDENREAADEMR